MILAFIYKLVYFYNILFLSLKIKIYIFHQLLNIQYLVSANFKNPVVLIFIMVALYPPSSFTILINNLGV